jgi:hypothetical protein
MYKAIESNDNITAMPGNCLPEGVFLDVIGTEILIPLLYAIHSHLLQLILLPAPDCFYVLEISAA